MQCCSEKIDIRKFLMQELAPNFAGTLTGISNTLATIPGFLAPEVTGAIINNQVWILVK